ncbi:MAG: methylmalonyl-CoA mutase family protein [Syntrophales bacterium]|nr:methylmalonyl-CoA mutase family protein [Syntrophales bacterium]
MSDQLRKEKITEAYREAVTDFKTDSGIPVKELYTQDDLAGINVHEDIGLPGEYPFTRGHHPKMYRGKLWNIRNITGLSTPKAYNERLRYLIGQGMTAIECELDNPTFYGLEPDQPAADGHLGVCGTCLHSLKDVEEMLEGLPLDALSFSSAPAVPDVSQAYILTAMKHGCDINKLRGLALIPHFYLFNTCVPDQEYITFLNGRTSTIFRWSNDFLEYICRNLSKWNGWYSSGYDIREAFCDAVQEIAYSIAIRNETIREMVRRGIDVNVAAQKLMPVLSVSQDFFEEVAKFRAARKIWAATLKRDFGVTDQNALCLRFHANIAGSSFTRQQPLVNLMRGTLGCLAGVLGGAMGIQVPSYDEAWATPSEDAATLAVRTQQIIRYESGVPRVADPMAGSYYVEWLTNEMAQKIEAEVDKIEKMGGWLEAMRTGWVKRELEKSQIALQGKIESGEKPVIGVNRFIIPPEEDFKPKRYAPDVSKEVEPYLAEYVEWRDKKRDKEKVKRALEKLYNIAGKTNDSLVPCVFEALEADVTFAEIRGVLRMVDGLEYDWAGERKDPF